MIKVLSSEVREDGTIEIVIHVLATSGVVDIIKEIEYEFDKLIHDFVEEKGVEFDENLVRYCHGEFEGIFDYKQHI